MRSARLFSLVTGVLALSACGGNGSGPAQGTSPLIPSQAGGAASPMARDTESQDLLYVANRKDGGVFVYSYPEGKPKGSLAGVKASGLCSDANGNVFIPQGREILEYAHGGTRPIAALRNPLGGATQFCAVDPATGDLAVSGGAGRAYGVAIYAGAKGEPTTYPAGDRNGRYWTLTYDDKGNLFVEVATAGVAGAANLVELSKGAARFKGVTWKGRSRPSLGSIQYDGKYLAVESPQTGSAPTTIFRYAMNGRQAVPAGKTALAGAGSHLQIWIAGSQVVVPNQNGATAGVALYDYPRAQRSRQIVDDARGPQSATVSPGRHRKVAVTTYHYDNLRTGWDDEESVLTNENVNSGSFGLLHAVTVDDQVDTQPLIVPNEKTTRGLAQGKHDVAYVATENDTIYAIDATSGTVLFQQNFGSPVPYPLGCNNNGPNVGIDSTPVIDKKANAMYVITYTLQGSVPVYQLHELNLSNLNDIVAPVVVSASHKLSNGDTFTFNATYQRQRPALLESNGTIYAAFGSFCDFAASVSRGWLLGWQAGSLTPLAANRLNDTQPSSPDDFFLSSIWMSGYGPAADAAGNIYFVTGNSDYSGNTYNSVTNIAETVAKVSPDLTQLLSFFTPSDVGSLDQADADFGSGGVVLLPNGASKMPLAAAAGKEGTLFLLNRKHLGGYHPSGPNNDIDEEYVGSCWCGQSYFDAASDSVPRIVASGGNVVTVWRVGRSPVKLDLAASSVGLPNGQDPGFFTAISSNGSNPGAIIWVVARPESIPGPITLLALTADAPSSGSTLTTLYQAAAGSWTSGGGNANIVPVVANGKVYVASYGQLDIFGLLGSKKAQAPRIAQAPNPRTGAPNEVTGTLVAINGSRLTLRTRAGKTVIVDSADAVRRERSVLLIVGRPFDARGKYDASGVLHAVSIVRAKPSPQTWPPDR